MSMNAQTQTEQAPRVYTVEEVAKAVDVAPETIIRAIRRRQIEAVQIGRLYRIPRREYARLTGTDASPGVQP